ncbi:Uncharacterised protein [Mycobacterium tuberculosis]|nr:Uncharacterised protein [Mycobacterium tuberculosis]
MTCTEADDGFKRRPPRSALSTYGVPAAPVRFTVWLMVEVATGPPPAKLLPPPEGACCGKPRNFGRSGNGVPNGDGKNGRGLAYGITVGVPVTVQPGTVTPL